MRPSLPRLVRVIPRSQLSKETVTKVKALPEPVRSDIRQPTLMELLQKRKEEACDSYPSNIRIEPPIAKAPFKDLPAHVRAELRELARER